MPNIRVEARDVWDFYVKHKLELHDRLHLIAFNDEYGSSIYISEEDGFPNFTVFMDDSPVDEAEVCTAAECKKTAQELYDKYLYSNAVSEFIGRFAILDDDDDIDDDGKEDAAGEKEDMEDKDRAMDDRDQDLGDAMWEFLSVVLGDDYNIRFIDEIAEDVLDHVLEYLYRKHGCDIYRPMYLEDENGAEFYAEYPYACMEFDDPDNPLYKS